MKRFLVGAAISHEAYSFPFTHLADFQIKTAHVPSVLDPLVKPSGSRLRIFLFKDFIPGIGIANRQ